MFNNFSKAALGAGLAIAAISAPASAQVNGMATSDISVAVAGSTALQTGFQQISETYTAQITQLEQLQTQRNGLLQQLDTNGDGQLDEAEAAAATESNPVVQQIGSLDQQINTVQAPIQLARLFVVNQVGQQYAPSVQQVMAAQNIQIMLAPEAVTFANDESFNVTQAVTTAINGLLPAVSITPPAGWQPNQATVDLYEQVQQVFAIAIAQQQQAAAANGTAQQPAAVGR